MICDFLMLGSGLAVRYLGLGLALTFGNRAGGWVLKSEASIEGRQFDHSAGRHRDGEVSRGF